jgi:uncharacterized protein YodC (DUF2158 family)
MVTVPAVTTATKPKAAAAAAEPPKPARRRLKVGNTVRLKSGGHYMSVTAVCQDGSIRCAWFGSNQKTQRAAFPEAALEFQSKRIWDDERDDFIIVNDANDD